MKGIARDDWRAMFLGARSRSLFNGTMGTGGVEMAASDTIIDLNQKAVRLLQEDADKIEKLIAIQMENLTTRKCPLYEEVLDTQMYGFSRAVDFAVRTGLVEEGAGKFLINQLERNLAILYEALERKEG
jgi:uncharacterized protein YlaN (UPF0358 family)